MAKLSFIENYNNSIYAKTKKYQKIYGFQIGSGVHDTWNNEADAFKHTFMQADLALKYTTGLSKLVGDYHENQASNNPPGEKNMDLWNNQQGRRIADQIRKEYGKEFYKLPESMQDDIIADKVHGETRVYTLGENLAKHYKKVELIFGNGILSFINLVPKDMQLTSITEIYGQPKVIDHTPPLKFYEYANFIVTLDEKNNIISIGIFDSWANYATNK